ncbi:MAG: rod shape-determining protein RodA [Candidatus Yonathbacteria bacterium RIFCSPLOWO2_01_FULL_43_27]|uniref:Rod shape-determining protein RodA n=1 Tax=Candidatus Yonathbacteria bacterium RIFCSPLOWO2_01_FULL_43_27 TaxID=1802726 RepID=A0A1G2SDC3_9BACT|nr:MAG: rod shape-determining protein RodA [Candidatus Yonathbacteria bacterium RIFCSPLOWO2_01_FULL_43_27]
MKFLALLREVFPRKASTDWVLFFSVLLVVSFGLVTMSTFAGENFFFEKQIISLGVAIGAFFLATRMDTDILKRTDVLVGLFLIMSAVLLVLFGLGSIAKGAQSWFKLGMFAFQPADAMKLLLILILAKYFSRRHIEIAHFRHIIVSGVYALIPFAMVLLQPDFGSAMIIFFIWVGMILVSGVSKKHLALVFIVGMVAFGSLWVGVFKPYQKARILTFFHPLADIRGTGYNAYQSTIAVGAGQVVGKGVGYGTQSRLRFLPEYQTDFIFSAFAEEWGLVGVSILFALYTIIIVRILMIAMVLATNFEMLYGIGVAVFFIVHFTVNIGMTIGLLPVTGVPVPFMSFGGSHLLVEFLALGLLVSMKKTSRSIHRSSLQNEFLGYDQKMNARD